LGNKPEGTLVEGGTVKIKDGMIFNVTATAYVHGSWCSVDTRFIQPAHDKTVLHGPFFFRASNRTPVASSRNTPDE
jgi:Multiubiquitin